MSNSINAINVNDMVSLFAFIIEYSHELEDDEKEECMYIVNQILLNSPTYNEHVCLF